MTASKNIYQLKVTLDGSKPPIWRRLLVPGNVNLYELHAIIQLGMGWTNSHLHMFRFGEEIYGDPQDDDFGELGFKDETRFRLDKLASQEGIKFQYEYDFGDSWDHSIQVEKILPAEKGSQFPLCIAGKRARPPEDVGGIGGYELFLQAIADPNDEEHDEYLEWAGGSFDPEKFDLEEINEALRHYKRFSEYMLDEDFPIEETEEGLHKLIAWVQSLSKEQVNQFEMLALRRDMLAFLSYLGENRVTGTQSTGNLPLKAVREICAQFVDPPILDHTLGKYIFNLRTEDDVWPLIFIHTLAHVSGMVNGGPARRWQVTEEGKQFPQLPAPVQVAFLLQHWWHRVNWAICFQFSGLGDEPPAGFNRHTLACLLELPAGKALSYETFADRLIGQSGLSWPIQNQISARNTLHSAIERMVVDPLVRFGVVEAGYLSKTSQLYRSPELDTISLTQAGKDILGLL